MAMILLKPGHRALGETCSHLLEWEADVNSDDPPQRSPTKVKLWDFDSVHYYVKYLPTEQESNIMRVSMAIPFWDEIKDHGAGDALDEIFGELVDDVPDEGYNITLKIDFDELTDSKDQQELSEKIEMFKPNVIGGVYRKYFAGLASRTELEPFVFHQRPDTQVYFCPGQGRVVVVFGIDFRDHVEKTIAEVFLQEFSDAKSRGAPPCNFYADPPRELKQFDVTENTGNLGYISFAVLSNHVNTEDKQRKVSATLQSFRTYLQYHIKCSKSYFHSRMRARVTELLKVLNRARVKAPGGKKSKKSSRQ